MVFLKNFDLPVDTHASEIVSLVKSAGVEIMEIYKRDFNIYEKGNNNPLTEADTLSHRVITACLRRLTPEIPILSEESKKEDIEDRLNWETYWLVDPLDGTKEFIKKNGEFTVNIALIHSNQVIFGAVDAPALGVTYWGGKDIGAYKLEGKNKTAIRVSPQKKRIRDMKIIGSRSHHSEKFSEFLADYPGASVLSIGSSLKLCLVADGSADLYPRLGPTYEWDTAAAQAVVEGAGGSVISISNGLPLRYNTNHNTLLNPEFLVSN